MWAGILALLIHSPVLTLPRSVRAELRYQDARVYITMDGDIQDPVRVWAPQAREVWINGEKMTCRRYGNYRLATYPILHNQEACELY